MSTTEVPFSELVNRPKATVEKLNSSRSHRLRLVRRDDEDLVLESAAQAEMDAAAMTVTTRLFVSLMKNDDAAPVLLQALPEVFPWVKFLPAEEVRAFFVELVETARACVEIDNLAPLFSVVDSWRSTAEVHADPELYEILTRPLDGTDHGAVPPPYES